MHPGLKLDYRQQMHKPQDGGEEDVHLLRQEQGFPSLEMGTKARLKDWER